jgi:quinol monooxygenase YgiN
VQQVETSGSAHVVGVSNTFGESIHRRDMELFLFARFHARPGCEQRVRQAIAEVQGPTRAEAGCLGYRAFQSVRDSSEFYVHSRWQDQSAFELHATLAHTLRFVACVEPLLDHPLAVSLTKGLP